VDLRRRIRRHYDRWALVYRRWWGDHIHHGLFDPPDLPPARAQERLLEALAAAADLRPGARVLDVGCGFGAGALWLADRYDARVLGWTLSRAQARIAARARRRRPAGARTVFALADAATWPARPGSVDVVWIVECLEHLPDRRAALAAAARTLRPGGRLALCTWLAARERDPAAAAIARAFLCPDLATREAHLRWIRDAGLELVAAHDWTAHVRPTWTHVGRRVGRFWVRAAAAALDADTREFLRGCREIARAYDAGHLRYGCLVARAPT
jgi:tocopherol O-methyltransferase